MSAGVARDSGRYRHGYLPPPTPQYYHLPLLFTLAAAGTQFQRKGRLSLLMNLLRHRQYRFRKRNVSYRLIIMTDPSPRVWRLQHKNRIIRMIYFSESLKLHIHNIITLFNKTIWQFTQTLASVKWKKNYKSFFSLPGLVSNTTIGKTN